MVIELMVTVSFYLNAFVWKYRVSEVLPPLTIVEGVVLDFNLHFRVIYSEFCQTYEGTDNTMNLRTTDSVALGPNGNLQGGIHCFSLNTCKVLQQAWRDVTIAK